MSTFIIATLFTTSVLCLAFYIYDYWAEGQDLTVLLLLTMMLAAAIPFLNLIIVVFLTDLHSRRWIVLKGRK